MSDHPQTAHRLCRLHQSVRPFQGHIDVDAEVSHGAFELGMPSLVFGVEGVGQTLRAPQSAS
jgi:hypothetical protein